MVESEDLKQVIAKNITALRKKSKLTQLELADALNYTDKAVSKWERGESIPDVVILKRIADLFGVTVDYLLTDGHDEDPGSVPTAPAHRFRTHALILGISLVLVWLLATLAFVIGMPIISAPSAGLWLVFIYAIPVSCIVWLIFNSLWFNRKRNFLIISLLMWSLLTAVFLSIIVGGHNAWPIFLLGIPGQVIILLWSGIGRKPKIKG